MDTAPQWVHFSLYIPDLDYRNKFDRENRNRVCPWRAVGAQPSQPQPRSFRVSSNWYLFYRFFSFQRVGTFC